MADRGFLRPRSVIEPPQGDFVYMPRVFVYESDTAAGLEALMNPAFETESADSDWFWVIESIQYQVATTRLHNTQPNVRYSALVWATQVLKN